MATDTLPALHIHQIKDSVPTEIFETITSTVAQKLAFVLRSATKSSKPLEAQPLAHFLSSYLSDVARQKLAQISTSLNKPYIDTLSDSERAIRKHTMHLIRSLASHQQPIPAALIVDLAVSYLPNNTNALREIFRNVLSVPAQASEFASSVVPAFTSALLPKHPDVIELREVAHVLLCIASCGDEVVGLFVQNSSFVKALVECYQNLLPKLANSLGGIHLKGERSTYETTWVETKADLLDSYDVIIRTLIKSSKSVDRALEIIFQVFEVSKDPSPNSTLFLDTSLNDDLNRLADLASLFKDVVPSDDPRLEVMSAQLAPITSKTDLGVLALLPVSARPAPVVAPIPRTDKGKGKQAAAVCTS
jgi:activating signal cointegrator complex subunit 2